MCFLHLLADANDNGFRIPVPVKGRYFIPVLALTSKTPKIEPGQWESAYQVISNDHDDMGFVLGRQYGW